MFRLMLQRQDIPCIKFLDKHLYFVRNISKLGAKQILLWFLSRFTFHIYSYLDMENMFVTCVLSSTIFPRSWVKLDLSNIDLKEVRIRILLALYYLYMYYNPTYWAHLSYIIHTDNRLTCSTYIKQMPEFLVVAQKVIVPWFILH